MNGMEKKMLGGGSNDGEAQMADVEEGAVADKEQERSKKRQR